MDPGVEARGAMTAPSPRRRFLQRTALLGLLGTVGCLGDDVGRARESPDDGTATPGSTPRDTASPGDASTTDATTGTPVPSLDEWLAGANGYRDEIPRFAPGSQPTIAVGHPTDDGIAFDPPAVQVDPGTTIIWEWTGNGGQHNVVAEEGGEFESELTAEAGFTFEQTLDSEGVIKYFCQPHRALGMKGVVVVGGAVPEGAEVVDGGSSGGGDSGGGSGGESGGGGGSESGSSGGSSSPAGNVMSLMVGGSLVAAFLSPIVFGLVLLLRDKTGGPPDDAGAEHGEPSHED